MAKTTITEKITSEKIVATIDDKMRNGINDIEEEMNSRHEALIKDYNQLKGQVEAEQKENANFRQNMQIRIPPLEKLVGRTSELVQQVKFLKMRFLCEKKENTGLRLYIEKLNTLPWYKRFFAFQKRKIYEQCMNEAEEAYKDIIYNASEDYFAFYGSKFYMSLGYSKEMAYEILKGEVSRCENEVTKPEENAEKNDEQT